MSERARRRRLIPALAALALATPPLALAAPPAAAAPAPAGYATISGGGSTWSQIAIDSWKADLVQAGLTINYEGSGSTAGRKNYILDVYDFAVSEIPFQEVDEGGFGSEIAQAKARPYAYLPIVAGGTAFMYNLSLGGRRVTDLRLSGDTLTKIFTGAITRWNDPQITREYGRPLPNVRIVPVVRSDGSGTSAQFSAYMSARHAGVWNPFCQRYLRTGNCRFTSFYPTFPGAKAQAGSNGVSNYVAASYGNGAITYVEYGYAKQLNFPVVKVLNAKGYYVSPTAGNVAVALTQAKINPADLTQDLGGVYANQDARAYPLSSYSYMIVPVAEAGRFTAVKGRSLSTFVNYFLCEGQQRADVLGYSPLPTNLVQAGFNQVNRIPGRVAPPSLSRCNNPALNILRTAPNPPACDRATSAPCGSGGSGGGGGSSGGGGGSSSGGGGGSSSGGGGGSSSSGGGGGSSSGGGGGSSSSGGGGSSSGGGGGPGPAGGGGATPGGGPAPVDPETGLPTTTGGGGGDGTGGGGEVYGVPVELAASREDRTQRRLLYMLAGAELVAVILLPPLLASRLRRRRS